MPVPSDLNSVMPAHTIEIRPRKGTELYAEFKPKKCRAICYEKSVLPVPEPPLTSNRLHNPRNQGLPASYLPCFAFAASSIVPLNSFHNFFTTPSSTMRSTILFAYLRLFFVLILSRFFNSFALL